MSLREPDFLVNIQMPWHSHTRVSVKIPSSFANVIKLATHNGKILKCNTHRCNCSLLLRRQHTALTGPSETKDEISLAVVIYRRSPAPPLGQLRGHSSWPRYTRNQFGAIWSQKKTFCQHFGMNRLGGRQKTPLESFQRTPETLTLRENDSRRKRSRTITVLIKSFRVIPFQIWLTQWQVTLKRHLL